MGSIPTLGRMAGGSRAFPSSGNSRIPALGVGKGTAGAGEKSLELSGNEAARSCVGCLGMAPTFQELWGEPGNTTGLMGLCGSPSDSESFRISAFQSHFHACQAAASFPLLNCHHSRLKSRSRGAGKTFGMRDFRANLSFLPPGKICVCIAWKQSQVWGSDPSCSSC